MSKRFIITVVTLLVIVMAAGVAIFLAKGYTFSPAEKRIVGTGIITVSSQPDSASVYIDGHLTTATNATISSLSPKQYSVRIIKEGFIPWEKQITVKEGLVTEVKVTLFPAIPTIYPLTFTGVLNPVLSPDGDKLAYLVPSGKKAGVWVWTMAKNQPIAFTRSSEPHQIATNAVTDFSKAALRWSADSKQVLATVSNNNYLLEFDRLNSEPRDITPVLAATIKSWEEDQKSKNASATAGIIDPGLRQVASSSAIVRWSPDETKMMVRKNPVSEKESSNGSLLADFKVYDLEDKKEYSLPAARSHAWLPDSRHIILVEESAISVVDFDGTNKAVIFAGSFLDNFVFPWPDSSRLVIISSFPTPTASEPNLYGINLK
ncbi:PEGA domain-containing protein [Candidatus Daviesbacteria bacterium]|nr:PEGA domain-containing protein [Candidatus Daviesbacteria bacterium]